MKRLQKLGADRMRILKALVNGGRVEKRREYPFPSTYHLIKVDALTSPPSVSELAMSDLIARKLVAPCQPVDLSQPGAADLIDFVATLAAHRVVQAKGIEYDDPQDALFDESVGKHARSDMEAA